MIAWRRRTQRTQKMLGEGDAELFAFGRAPCVIAFHGFGGTASELRPVLDRIAQSGVALDAALLPGHGTRVERLQDETFDSWVSAARERSRAAAAKHGTFVLLGFSLGSLVAMQIASERPPGLVGLVALGNALTLSWPSSVPLRILSVFGARVPDAYLIKPRPADLVDKSAMNKLLTYDRHPLRAALEVYRAGGRVRSVVSRIVCPTLILHGRRDIVCPPRNATWLAKHLGSDDVRVRVFERSAHVLACDGEREQVAEEVVAFLTRVSPAATATPATRAPEQAPPRGARAS